MAKDSVYIGLVVISLIILVIGIILLVTWAFNKTKYANLRIWGIILTVVGGLMFIISATLGYMNHKKMSSGSLAVIAPTQLQGASVTNTSFGVPTAVNGVNYFNQTTTDYAAANAAAVRAASAFPS